MLTIAGLVGCAPGKGTEDDVVPEVRFENLSFEVLRGPAVEASGTLARARMRRDTSDLAAEQIVVDFPAAAGRSAARLTAARGTGNASARWFALEGAVHAAQAGDVVETERARYDGKDRLVHGDAPVTVRGQGYVLSGPGFTLDPDGRTVRTTGGSTLRVAGAGAGARR